MIRRLPETGVNFIKEPHLDTKNACSVSSTAWHDTLDRNVTIVRFYVLLSIKPLHFNEECDIISPRGKPNG